jgi:hypothetical protein
MRDLAIPENLAGSRLDSGPRLVRALVFVILSGTRVTTPPLWQLGCYPQRTTPCLGWFPRVAGITWSITVLRLRGGLCSRMVFAALELYYVLYYSCPSGPAGC